MLVGKHATLLLIVTLCSAPAKSADLVPPHAGASIGQGNEFIHVIPALSTPSVKNGEKVIVSVVIKANAGVRHVSADMGGLDEIELRPCGAAVAQGGLQTVGLWSAEWAGHDLEEKFYTIAIKVADCAGHVFEDRSLRFSDPVAGNDVIGSSAYPDGGMSRATALKFNPGEDVFNCAVIDTVNGFAYFGAGQNSIPAGVIVKVALNAGDSEPTRVGTLLLNPGETNLRCAVIDTTKGYAYFGTNTAPGIVIKIALGAFTALPRRIGAVTLNAGENALHCAVIDAPHNFAYFGTITSPGKLVEVSLGGGNAAPARIGALTFDPGENAISCGVIDAPNGYAYFGTNTSPGKVLKVALGPGNALPTRVGALTLAANESALTCAVIDTARGYACFGTGTSPAMAVKVSLGAGAALPVRIESMTANSGEDAFTCGVLDASNGMAYFGATNRQVVKVALGALNDPPARLEGIAFTPPASSPGCAVIDPGNGYAYFGTGNSPGIIEKVSTGANFSVVSSVSGMAAVDAINCTVIDAANGYAYCGTIGNELLKIALGTANNPPSLVGQIELEPNEFRLAGAVLDTVHGYGYFGNSASTGIIVKIALGIGDAPPVRVGALVLNSGEKNLSCAVIDVPNGYAYFGTQTLPANIVKIALGAGDAPPSRVGALTLDTNSDGYLTSAVIDQANGYAYFGTLPGAIGGSTASNIIKVALGTGDTPPARTGTLTLQPRENALMSAVIDPGNGYAYFGTQNFYAMPGAVIKIALGAGSAPPTRVGAVTLGADENSLLSAAIDVAGGVAYFGTQKEVHSAAPPIKVVKVDLGTGAAPPVRLSALALLADENQNPTVGIDAPNGNVYCGVGKRPASFIKIALSKKNAIQAIQTIVPEAAAVTDVRFYSHAASGKLRLAIYDNNSPRQLRWQSNSISNIAVNALLTAPISAGTPNNVLLSPGTYWLAWQTDSVAASGSYAAGNAGDGFTSSLSFGSFPAALADAQVAGTADRWTEYMTYDVPPPAPGNFAPIAPLGTARQHHTTTLLPSGKVLVVGGLSGTGGFSSTELYDPGTNTWTVAASLNVGRYDHTATLLRNGKVLVAGGYSHGYLTSAELFDPLSNTWSPAGILATERESHTATLLPNGKVLAVGGFNGGQIVTAEIYDPASNNWSAAPNLAFGRSGHTATLLPSGKVLVAAGGTSISAMNSAELYDPATNIWSAAGTLAFGRSGHTASLLPNGKVLVVCGGANNTAELYDPATNGWTPAGTLSVARFTPTATLLPSGIVLITGGSAAQASAELYNPGSNTWTAAGSLSTTRLYHTATLLPSGKVLVAGGSPANSGVSLSSVELYDFGAGTWSGAGGLANSRYDLQTTLLPDGKVLVTSGIGDGPSAYLSNVEIYDPYANPGSAWSVTGSMATGRCDDTTTLLPNGKVLVTGGFYHDDGGMYYLSSAELYDPSAGTWSSAGDMANTRAGHRATLLPNGKVLISGGLNAGNDWKSAELYDPSAPPESAWSSAGNMAMGRYNHRATLLPNGKVLVTGGDTSGAYVKAAELYDPAAPAASAWSFAGNMAVGRDSHTTTLLPNGKLLVAGGNNGSVLKSAEVYDPSAPAAAAWSTAADMSTPRANHTATLLPSGIVLVASGQTTSTRFTFNFTAAAETYDPATGAWSAAGNLTIARMQHAAALLPTGKVLVVGGYKNGAQSSAELYDPGLGYQQSWRSAIVSATSPLQVKTPMAMTGAQFTGISEASSGVTNNSASNNPVVILQSLANEQVRVLKPDPTNPWSASSYRSLAVDPLPGGYALLTLIVNGIPSQSSIIQINNPNGVTPVTVADFTAQAEGAGVRVEWTAVSEFQNAGFNLYRRAVDEPQPQGNGMDYWTHVNPSLIAGRISHPDPKVYRLYDWPQPGAYQYKLESVSLDSMHESYAEIAGPVMIDLHAALTAAVVSDGLRSACESTDAVAQARRGEELGAKFRGIAKTGTVRPIDAGSLEIADASRATAVGRSANVANGPSFPLPTPRWFSSARPNTPGSYVAAKIIYETPGILRIPQASLPAGFDIRHVAIQREGRAVTALAITEDSLLLYAPGYEDDYTDKDAIFLRRISGNTAAGRAFSAAGLFGSAQAARVDAPASVTASYHDVYYDYSTRPYDFPPWFSGKYLTDGTDQTFAIDTPFANGGAATLVVNLWSLTQSESGSPDHALQAIVNGHPVGQAQWTGGGKMMQLAFDVNAGVLAAGTNQIDLITPARVDVESQISFLHSMTVTYTRTLDASKPVTIVSANGANVFELSARSASVWIVDARYPDRAELIPYESQAQADGTYKIRFVTRTGGTGGFLAVPAGQENLALTVSKRQIRPVPSSSKYLAVGPTQFGAGIQPLLSKRSKEGIRASFVDQEQIFDYYGFGRYGPAAIQNAVRSARPDYLLLLGRTSYDYKNYGGLGVDPLCPAFLVSTTTWAQTTSDAMFGDLGRGYPEVAIGRLPVNGTAELNGAVNHILSYKGVAGSSMSVHAIADLKDPNVADFAAQTETIGQANAELGWQRNYLGVTSQTAPEVTTAMTDAANGGADLILYVGHGNAARMGATVPRILDVESVQAWNGNTVFLPATCTANWMAKVETGYKSIVIQALTQPQGGISASIGSSTYVTSEASVEFMNQLLKNASVKGARWGGALLKAQQWTQIGTRTGTSDIYSDLGRTEQLFGDPALQVYAPRTTSNPASNTATGRF